MASNLNATRHDGCQQKPAAAVKHQQATVLQNTNTSPAPHTTVPLTLHADIRLRDSINLISLE